MEGPVAHVLQAHFGNAVIFRPLGASSDHILEAGEDDACVFLDRGHGGLCRVHSALGPGMLPSACRHFPRITLNDARGTFITLSHFCPTAAGLLFTDTPVVVVAAPDTLTLDGTVEGLDATGALPPLLRPGMLMDLDAYDSWERGGIRMLASTGGNADDAIGAVAAATRACQEWSPGGAPLKVHVERTFQRATHGGRAADAAADSVRYALTVASVPPGLQAPAPVDLRPRWREVGEALEAHDRVVRRYLASKLFANWYAWQGAGVATVVEALRVHAAVLRMETARRVGTLDGRMLMLEAIRAADLLMVHLADGRRLAALIDRMA